MVYGGKGLKRERKNGEEKIRERETKEGNEMGKNETIEKNEKGNKNKYMMEKYSIQTKKTEKIGGILYEKKLGEGDYKGMGKEQSEKMV